MVARMVPVGARRVPGQRWTGFAACCSDMLRGVFVVVLPAPLSALRLHTPFPFSGGSAPRRLHCREADEDFVNEAMHVHVAFLMLMASSLGTMWAGRPSRGLWEMAEKSGWWSKCDVLQEKRLHREQSFTLDTPPPPRAGLYTGSDATSCLCMCVSAGHTH